MPMLVDLAWLYWPYWEQNLSISVYHLKRWLPPPPTGVHLPQTPNTLWQILLKHAKNVAFDVRRSDMWFELKGAVFVTLRRAASFECYRKRSSVCLIGQGFTPLSPVNPFKSSKLMRDASRRMTRQSIKLYCLLNKWRAIIKSLQHQTNSGIKNCTVLTSYQRI